MLLRLSRILQCGYEPLEPLTIMIESIANRQSPESSRADKVAAELIPYLSRCPLQGLPTLATADLREVF